MSSFDTDHLSLDAPTQHPVEVFCVGSHIAGMLRSGRPRVSDHLESDEQVIEIVDATLKSDHPAIPLVENNRVYINKPMVLFVLDLTLDEWSGSSDMRHPTEPHDILVSVGDFWISGRFNLSVEGDLQRFLARSPRRFIPVTDADIIGYDEQTPANVLIHRDYIEAIVERTAETDELLQTE